MKLRFSWTLIAWCLLTVAGMLSLAHLGLLDPRTIGPALGRLGRFAALLMPPRLEPLPTLMSAMLETIEIAFAGSLVGFVLAIPIGFLGTRGMFAPAVTTTVRLFIGALRTIPSILLGVIFVVAFGLGPAAGTIGVACYTLGYLGKLYYETFEAVDPEVLEAIRSTGSSRLQLLRFAMLPEAANAVISQLFFMFEYNIRASAIMGFVGAGGIGYYMLGYVQLLQYQHLFTAMLLTFLVVMVVDYASLKLRAVLVPAANLK